MAGSLGTISGQVRLDVSQAIAAFAALRTSTAASSGAMAAAGSKISTFGKVSMVAGLALVAGFGVAIKAAADFEKKMDYFGAVNNATAKEMEQVRAKALQLGRDSQYSAGQIADAFVEMGKAGVSVKDITGGLADAIVNMAAAADIHLDQATQIVTSTIQTYGLSVKDASHVTDLFAGAANASIVDVEDLGVSLKYVGGVAHALGISFDSTTTALSLLGKAGIKGSTAGTSLRQIMVSLAGGTQKAKDELESLGIITKDGTNEFFTATGKAKSLDQVFQILQDHTRGLTQQQQLMAFRTIFNNRALAAAEILTKSGAKGFADMNAQMSKTTAATVAAKRMDNLSGDMKKLKSSIDTLMIQAGTPFQNMLRGVVQWITKLVNAFINMPTGVQTAILAFIGIAGVVLTLMGGFILLAGTILKFGSTVRELRAAFRIVDVAIRGVGTAMRFLTGTLLTSPIFWIVVAVIAVAAAFYLLYTRCETFRNAVNKVGAAIKTGFMAVVDWFKGLPKWFSDRWKEISNAFMVGVNWVKKNWDILLALLTGPFGLVILVWRRFGDQIVNFFKAIPGQIASFASTAWNAIIGFFGKLPYYIGFAIGFTLGIIARGFMIAGLAIWNFCVSAYKNTVDFFSKLPGRIASFFTELYNGFINWAISFGAAILNWATTSYTNTVNWFQKLPGRIAEFFTDAWHKAQSLWNAFVIGAASFATRTYSAIVNWFTRLPGRIASFVTDMKNRAVTGFNNLVSSAGTMGMNMYKGIVDWVNKIPGAVWDAVNSAISAFENMISSAWNAAKQFASGLWDGFKKGLGINSPSLIEKQMWQITDVTQTETKKLVGTVRMMQSLHNRISAVNPAKSASALNMRTISGMTDSMARQAALLQAASNSLFPGVGPIGLASRAAHASSASTPSGTGSGSALAQQNINVQVFNPVAERASDSTARKLRQLSDMGAL
jgi:TP901 family phage tail tape measure protein